MTGRLTLGYRRASAVTPSPLADSGRSVRGHEFHYARLEPEAGERPAWVLGDPVHGGTRPPPAARAAEGERPEGFVAGGVHASFLHTHWAAFPDVPRRLVAAAAAAGVDR
jgi:cobyrinic acid a,c-diamide synthase